MDPTDTHSMQSSSPFYYLNGQLVYISIIQTLIISWCREASNPTLVGPAKQKTPNNNWKFKYDSRLWNIFYANNLGYKMLTEWRPIHKKACPQNYVAQKKHQPLQVMRGSILQENRVSKIRPF